MWLIGIIKKRMQSINLITRSQSTEIQKAITIKSDQKAIISKYQRFTTK